MIIDATNLVMGRIAAFAAKKALVGEKVDIINCEKAIVTGSRRFLVGRYFHQRDRGVLFTHLLFQENQTCCLSTS